MQGTRKFEAYVTDMLWAHDYATANRNQTMDRAMGEVPRFIGTGTGDLGTSPARWGRGATS